MADRKKVIKGLEQFKADFKPFCGNSSDWARVDDAIKLLKEQDYRAWIIDMFHKYNRDELIALMVQKGEESILAGLLKEHGPRVLTLCELWHMEHKPVYLQRKNSRLYMVEPAILLTTERCYVPSICESYIFMRENKIRDRYWALEYNVTWRCWDYRPTDEQRLEVKWDGP